MSDAAATIRKHAGDESYYVLRDEGDANKIVHFSKWRSLAGVHAPEFIYLDSLEQGTL